MERFKSAEKLAIISSFALVIGILGLIAGGLALPLMPETATFLIGGSGVTAAGGAIGSIIFGAEALRRTD